MDTASVLLAHIDLPPKLIGSLVVLVLALIIWGIVALAKSGSKPQQHVAPNSPPCPTCGGPARWNYNGWVCDRCQRQVVPGMPMQPPMMQPGMQPNMAPPGMPPQQMMGHPGMPQAGMGGAAPQGPSCQTCGGPGRWIPESNAWGCDRCRQLIAPMQPA